MRRYAETFFRYWLIAVAPIIVLALVGYAMVHGTPKTVLASAKIWVDASSAGAASSGSYDQYVTPAQNEDTTLTQLLQISSFDAAVANGSAAYAQMLSRVPDPTMYAATDLQKNLQITAVGNNLVAISYSSKDWQLSQQVVQSFLRVAQNQIQQLSQQQATASITTYRSQLKSAQQSLTQATQALSRYMDVHGVSPSDLIAQQAVDPTLASLYQQVQSAQTSVSDIRQKLSASQAQSAASSPADQTGFRVVDPTSLAIVSSKKKELLNLAIYLVIGLVLGSGFVVVKTLLNRSLRHAGEVPAILDLPVLAVVPYDSALAKPDRSAQPVQALAPRRAGGLPWGR